MSQDEYPSTFEEIVSASEDIDVLRLKVPGGWLVVVRDSALTVAYSTTVFIPDPQNHWELA